MLNMLWRPNFSSTFFVLCLYNSFLNVKALVGTFNKEKALALVGAFSVIVKTLVRLQLY